MVPAAAAAKVVRRMSRWRRERTISKSSSRGCPPAACGGGRKPARAGGTASSSTSTAITPLAMASAVSASAIPRFMASSSLNDPHGGGAQGKLREHLAPVSKPFEEDPLIQALRHHDGVARHEPQRAETSVPQTLDRLLAEHRAVGADDEHAAAVGVARGSARPPQIIVQPLVAAVEKRGFVVNRSQHLDRRRAVGDDEAVAS